MKKGLFITFEGIDGCGKTTQMNLVSDYLKKTNFEIVFTREPGCSGLGEDIRNILLNYDDKVSDVCEAFLFLADRAQNIDIIVKPAVNSGKIVLCDRHIDSTIAYQGYARGGDIKKLTELNNIATGKFKPDLTLLFDISVQTSMERVGKNKDRMESESKTFFESVRQGYLDLAKNEPERIKVINAEDSIENVFNQVRKYIDEKIL